jgi:hypothetical protein
MLKLLINNGRGPVDYTRYVIASSINIEDSINTPTLISFTLVNADAAFQVPLRSAYVSLISTTSPLSVTGAYISTGYITNTIQRKFLGGSQRAGLVQRFQHYEYDVKVTSDEYLLNCKAVPFVAAYINQTMGQILSSLANTLAPGFFDLAGIQDGDLIPYFAYDPASKWSDVAKQFADQAQFRYNAVGKKITFAPYGDAPLGVIYDEVNQLPGQFVPSSLNTGVLSVPLVNDCLVVGEIEPQQMRDDYFVGDGFTGSFSLKYKMFHGSADILLQDDWTENQLNTSQWTMRDLQNQFVLAGALNSISPIVGGNPVAPAILGTEYILSNSGVELGGHTILQHGEVQFNDVSIGIIGGLYATSANMSMSGCLAGFDIRTAPNTVVTVTPSGANGVQMCPILSGALVGTPVVSKQNHHYVLETYVTARRWSRYNQIYRTLAGTVFGDDMLPALAEVTYVITDIDLAQAYNVASLNNPFIPSYTPTLTRYTASGVNLPSFAAYAIFNSVALNVTLDYTLIWDAPTALLQVAGLTGARPINALALTGGQLPLFDPNDNLAMPDTTPIGPLVNYPLGFGMDQDITATIAQNGDTDQLQFYSNTIPGVGARVRFQAWQAGHALARVRDPVSVSGEAAIVGDDGVRSAIITDMQPMPRTSDECDLAAAAYIQDREITQFDGNYTVQSYFWDRTKDYPRSGRFLYVTALQRSISGENFLVRSVTTTVLEMFQEVLQFDISFGQDLYLDKLLRRFVDNPQNILEPADTAVPVDLQNLPPPEEEGQFTTFLDNLQNSKVSFANGTRIMVDLGAPPVTGVEVRRSDTSWTFKTPNLLTVATTQKFPLPRLSYDDIWYMRLVNGSQTSRFTRVFRVNYPLVPTPPSSVTVQLGSGPGSTQATSAFPLVTVALPTNFDKNIYGMQIDRGPLFLGGATHVTIVSDQPGDTRMVSLYGYDSFDDAITEVLTLNGTSPVTSVNLYTSMGWINVED